MNTDAVLDVRGVKFGYDKADTLLHIEALKIQRGESVFPVSYTHLTLPTILLV